MYKQQELLLGRKREAESMPAVISASDQSGSERVRAGQRESEGVRGGQ